jgi:hypothetical protein
MDEIQPDACTHSSQSFLWARLPVFAIGLDLLMNQQGANGLPLNLTGTNFQATNEAPNPSWRDELTVQDRTRLVQQL